MTIFLQARGPWFPPLDSLLISYYKNFKMYIGIVKHFCLVFIFQMINITEVFIQEKRSNKVKGISERKR